MLAQKSHAPSRVVTILLQLRDTSFLLNDALTTFGNLPVDFMQAL